MAFILWVQPMHALAAGFADVPETHPQASAIQSLKDAGLVAGYSDGTFKPDATVSRAEALAMILKAAGTVAATAGKIPFTDVTDQDWFFPMVRTGISLGKIKGYEDKTFRPHNPVNLPEALALTLSFFKVNTKGIEIDPVIYGGLSSTEWYAPYAQYAKNKNLIIPEGAGIFDPAAALTRGQLAQLLFRMRTVAQTGKPIDIAQNWVTEEHIDNFWKLTRPPDWEVFKGQKNSVIWRASGLPVFFTRVWPEAARLSISVVENPENLTAAQYFSAQKAVYEKTYATGRPRFSELALGGRPALKIEVPEARVLDFLIALPNKNFLVLFGEWGGAPMAEFYKKQLEILALSYAYVERPPEPPKPVIPLEKRMEMLREAILVAGQWGAVAPLFPDKRLIHTDAIGVGTGPVDYYYSAEALHTIKLERNSGTVLNIRDGETNGF